MSIEQPIVRPGYFNQKPLLRVIADLRIIVGLQDSCIQTNQAAVLYFEEAAQASGNEQNFIRQHCTRHQISPGSADFVYVKSIQYKAYLMQTYNLLEPWFKELNRAYRYYSFFEGDWKTKSRDKSLDPFNQLLENIGTTAKRAIKAYPEYVLLDYYRLIRNSIVHLQEDKDEHKKTQKYFDDHIQQHQEYFSTNYQLDAPNGPDQISFADFKLYTRAVKYFSNILNDLCFPTVSDFVNIATEDIALEKKLRVYKDTTNPKALRHRVKALKHYCDQHFIGTDEAFRQTFTLAYLKQEGTKLPEGFEFWMAQPPDE